ncbi:MAG: alfa-L-rhamnosidase RamA [Clostridiales bacterium]|nr:alfa-L-rhamnosidase RamA [Clostridiales bacterium]
MLIRAMRTNHLTDPMGYMMTKPVFSWIAESGTGLRQASARIVIARDQAFSDIVYDTGDRADISSLAFEADFSPAPMTRYWWHVTVTADDGDSAVSDAAWFETGRMGTPWKAEWIKAPFAEHPELTATVELPEDPVSARIYAVGLGLFELSVNGGRAGDEVLLPLCCDYENWIQVMTFDVTDALTAGENAINVLLGKGWYMGRFGFGDEQADIFGSDMQLLLELRATMPDGREIVFGTDGSWRAVPSAVVDANIYDGEAYDARLEGGLDGVPVVPAEAPEGALTDRLSPPVRIQCKLPAPKLLVTPKGENVLDFGQVATGWVEFDADIPAGETVTLRYGELLQEGCFYQGNLRTAKQTFRYTSNGMPAHVRPHFTFFGFRYVLVEGLDHVDPARFRGCVIHSQLDPTGRIVTDSEKVNRLFANQWWGQMGNFLDVPTDCPQRDERMGWTGDAHVFAPTASFNRYTPAFYEKYLYDMALEQRTRGGSVPFVVPDVLGRIEKVRGTQDANPAPNGSCGWGDAAIGIPWTMWTFYGDRAMLGRQYENMKRWTDWIRTQDETRCGGRRLWLCGFHFADWLALDNPDKSSSLGGTDPWFIASCCYYNAALTTSRAAKALGYEEDAAAYARLADEIREAFRAEYFTPTGRIAEPTQTAMTMALAMDLVPQAHRERLKKDLREKLRNKNDHLDTGFMGTYYLCRTLTENGMADVAYTLLLNEDYPSWLYEVDMGATTIWERWNSVLPNGLVSDTGMNSMNHYAYGSIAEWMYRCMGGLNPVEDAPGFKRARITPYVDERFRSVEVSYDSAAGLYRTAWKWADGHVEYEVEVPFDCEASFRLEEGFDWTVDGHAAECGETALRPGRHEIVRG